MLDERAISAIVEEVLKKLKDEGISSPESTSLSEAGAFSSIDAAIDAAERAQVDLVALPVETRRKIVGAMRSVACDHAEELSRLALDETGLGKYKDKVSKNLLAATKTPGMEDLAAEAVSGDHGLTLVERAPYGLIGSITPSTNPSETIINNAIGMVAGGNSVVFNCHPSAARTSIRTIEILNSAIVAEGGPNNVLAAARKPTIETAQALMKHPKVKLLVVTGGGAVVREAMNSGKKVIAAGPGNPPVVVDETADLKRAGRHIVDGASLDNNIVCICEKEVFAVDSVMDGLKAAMLENGAVEIKGRDIEKLESLIIKENRGPDKHAVTRREWVGKDPEVMLSEIGVKSAGGARLIICETPSSHPFVWTELLMPVLAMVRMPCVDDAIKIAKLAEHGFGHSAMMHSTNITKLSDMARFIQTTVFVKNGPCYAGLGFGGEGYTSYTIASPTGEGLTSARTFTKMRRCVLVDYFRIV
ncbi:MAG: aldehyde dehydrogenase EutE [bacterium]|jgi:acyl-CoA reductase-like NAD-dependent aldehyde dehydrogenase